MKFPAPGQPLPSCPRCGKPLLVMFEPTTVTCYGCAFRQVNDGSLGHNDSFDDKGNVYCHLCDWQACCTTMEQIEWRLGEHLSKVHGKRCLRRRCLEDDSITEIPQ